MSFLICVIGCKSLQIDGLVVECETRLGAGLALDARRHMAADVALRPTDDLRTHERLYGGARRFVQLVRGIEPKCAARRRQQVIGETSRSRTHFSAPPRP
ncbi:hypothetical protein [Paraburkholderia heleia]|uniref:hypothetical protein n=1 Tax=Paraburkholderia heleia TaxID=634127 RepID=UPI002AB7D341|nr:hypothetical protein [Paraburkholderia heleia]